MFKLLSICFLFCLTACSCNQHKNVQETESKKQETAQVSVPPFNADSAYGFTKAQCDFGPRVPNTKAHDACAEYLIKKLQSYTSDVIVKKGVVTTFENTKLNIKNIIVSLHQ